MYVTVYSTSPPYTIALVQMIPAFLDREANLRKAEQNLRQAASQGAKLVCLPESFNLGYDGTRIPDMMAQAETEDGPTLIHMRSLAKELGVYVLSPIFFRRSDGGVENRAFLLDDQGTLLGGYSKTHPVGEERRLLHRGTEYPVFDTKLGKLGISICYDACFPETSRILALKGAEVLLVPAAWRGNFYFKEWWDINLSCRALDNLMYVAAVNMAGPTGEQYFAGKSQICSPIGERLHTCGVEEETILYGEIDLARISKEREFNTVLTDRHPEDYGGLLQALEEE